MPTLYRKTDKRPIPSGAETVTRKGRQVARWVDQRGRSRFAPLSEDGARILIERPTWYFDYDGPDGRKSGVKGYRDKEATESLAKRLERDAERQRQGLAPSVDPARMQTPWREAMDKWIADLARQGCDNVYRENMRRLLVKIAKECGWSSLATIRGEAVRDWLAEIKNLGVLDIHGKRKLKLPSDRTIDQYLEVAKRFLRWCCSQDPPYLEVNPLDSVAKIKNPKSVRPRRALSEAEMLRLLEVAGKRASLYRVAALTGLRKDELRQLQWRDVRLELAKPSLKLRPEANKSRREDRVPIQPEITKLLRSTRPDGAGPLDAVFPEMPTIQTFRRDLARANIPIEDAEKKRADFHSLRYTFCTFLARAGVPIRTAMELMRHKDPKLTLRIYCDAGHLETDEAVNRLPPLLSRPDHLRENAGTQSR